MEYRAEDLIPVKEYATMISRSPQRVYQMVTEGKLKEHKIDGVKFIVKPRW